jgi:hypothetical protein
MNRDNLCLIIGVAVILLIFYLYFTDYKNTPTGTKTLEGFISPISGSSLISIGANPLIDRTTTTNVRITPAPNTNFDITNILLGKTTPGWYPYSNNVTTLPGNANIIISLSTLNKITAIAITGVKAFNVFYSKSNNDPFSYEEVLYQSLGDTTLSEPSLLFELCDNTVNNINVFGSLTTTDGKPVYASFIKIVPRELNSVFSTCNDTSVGTGGRRTGSTIISDGLKLEVFGYPNDAKPDIGGESIKTYAKMYDELGNLLNNNIWIDRTSNNDPRLKIVFSETVDTGIKVTAKQINRIVFKGVNNGPDNTRYKYPGQISINYKLINSNINQTIPNINVNTDAGDNNQWSYYFPTPIIASELIIKPQNTFGEGSVTALAIADIFGYTVNDNQITALSEKSKKQYCSTDASNNDLSNSASELLNQQLEIQQLCDAMELQDKIKENNQKIQKNRQYLMQLEDQDKKIAALEDIVEKMKHVRTIREKNNDHNMVDEQSKQAKVDSQLAQLIADRKKNMKQLNLNIQLNTDSLNKMNQSVEKLENVTGNNTATTPIEGFTNPVNKYIPTPTSNYSQGFYYRPYSDSTIKTQLIESSEQPSPDLRVFGSMNDKISDLYEKVPAMKFYENAALCTSGCDTNAKFVKMQ